MDQILNRLNHFVDVLADRWVDAALTLLIGLVTIELILLLMPLVFRFTNARPGLQRVIKSLARVFLWIVLFIATLQALGLNNVFVALTGSSVIVALFLSTGVAPLVSDIMAGLFLGSDREFQPGAKVCAGDKQAVGTVVHMNIRKTYIKDSKGKVHVIPNSLIEKNEWVILEKSKGTLPGSTRRRKRRTLRKSA